MASGESSPSSPRKDAPLSPLAQRLVLALRHLAEEHDELVMVVRGFERHMRRNPFADDEIRGGLSAVRAHIDLILDDRTHDAIDAHA